MIDQKTVITASFDWNVRQGQVGYENVLGLADSNLAVQYAAQFDTIWSTVAQ